MGERGKIALEIGRRLRANSIRKEGRGERWVIIEKIDPTDFWLLVECLADSWEGGGYERRG